MKKEELTRNLSSMKDHVDKTKLELIYKPKLDLILFIQRKWRYMNRNPPWKMLMKSVRTLNFVKKLCKITNQYMPL